MRADLPARRPLAKHGAVLEAVSRACRTAAGDTRAMDIASAPPRVADARAAAALVADLGIGPLERAAVLYLDPEWRFLGRADFAGSADSVAPPLRTVVGEALRLGASALVLAHGHPSGTIAPSAADLAYTRLLGRVAAAVDLRLVDHLIVAGGRIASLRDDGWM
ncbi:hypothetical protein LPN01_12135 [Sphingomonas sp. A2-49]|uniref:JAB domain-containing protein n=1 Tax=Sphingomonas sp. A2-49 TaxID=1391375 RepID=UPI0021CE6707|nr:JAB domain-containing protein [Sphingomonas sp. A2-49]MCU6454827.1 hypothetical protein [Sphingomonas sp. A2-49]